MATENVGWTVMQNCDGNEHKLGKMSLMIFIISIIIDLSRKILEIFQTSTTTTTIIITANWNRYVFVANKNECIICFVVNIVVRSIFAFVKVSMISWLWALPAIARVHCCTTLDLYIYKYGCVCVEWKWS